MDRSGWKIENDGGKRWRIVGPGWTMQPEGNLTAAQAEAICRAAFFPPIDMPADVPARAMLAAIDREEVYVGNDDNPECVMIDGHVNLVKLAEIATGIERARCVEAIEYVRKNIVPTPGNRSRFDILHIRQTFKDACTVVKEKITGEDKEKWKPMEGIEG